MVLGREISRPNTDLRNMTDRFHRRSIRLKGYDYAQAGAYFVTACTHDRAHLFGDVVNGVMEPNAMGAAVQRCWDAVPEHMPMVVLDEFVVMPNHMHGIIVITDGTVPVVSDVVVVAGNFPPLRDTVPPPEPTRKMPVMVKNSLGHIMQTFKAAVSRQAVKDGLIARGTPIWQRGYYEHIIRDRASHERIARYIRDNPMKWNVSDREDGRLPK